MNEKEVIAAVDELALAKYGRTLNNDQRIILQGSHLGKTYQEIYNDNKDCIKSEFNTFERTTAPNFWKFLSELLDVKVSKNNFIGAVERAWRLKNEAQSNAEEINVKEQSSFSSDSKVETERENDTSTELLPIDWSEENYSPSADKHQPTNPYALVVQSKPETHMNDNEDLDNSSIPCNNAGVTKQEIGNKIEANKIKAKKIAQEAKSGSDVEQIMFTDLKVKGDAEFDDLSQEQQSYEQRS